MVIEKSNAYRIYGAYGTHAYLINQRAAKFLLKGDRPSIVADDFKWMNKKGLKIVNIYPNMVVALSSVKQMSSTILDKECPPSSIIPSLWLRFVRKYDRYCQKMLLKLGWLKQERGVFKIIKFI